MVSKDSIKQVIKNIIPSGALYDLRQVVYDVRALLYIGSGLDCPICNTTSRKFIDGGRDFECLKTNSVVGGGFFKNNYCPKCNSGYKERLLYLYLHEIGFFDVETTNKLSVLHVAPEWSLRNCINRDNYKEYITGDLNSKLVDIKLDVTRLQFESNTFDVVICNHVLEHVVDDNKALKELYRVTKAGGKCILQVPYSLTLKKSIESNNAYNMSKREREEKYGQWDHVRIYSKQDYISRLELVGFEVIEYGCHVDNNYSLHPDEKVICVTK